MSAAGFRLRAALAAMLVLALLAQLGRTFLTPGSPWRRARALAQAVEPMELSIAETSVPARTAGDPAQLELRCREQEQRLAEVLEQRRLLELVPQTTAGDSDAFELFLTRTCAAAGLELERLERFGSDSAAPDGAIAWHVSLRGGYAGVRELARALGNASAGPCPSRFEVALEDPEQPVALLRVKLELLDRLRSDLPFRTGASAAAAPSPEGLER